MRQTETLNSEISLTVSHHLKHKLENMKKIFSTKLYTLCQAVVRNFSERTYFIEPTQFARYIIYVYMFM